MTTASSSPGSQSAQRRLQRGRICQDLDGELEMKVSIYDQVSSLLLALLMFVGFFVTTMFLIWFTTVLTWKQEMPLILVAEQHGDGEEPTGYEDELEPPGLEDVEEVIDPQIEQTLEAVTSTVSLVAASFNPVSSDASSSSKGPGPGNRGPGPVGIGDSIPRWERWEIHYASDKIDEYARQLDFFDIELGAAGGGSPQIDYASRFSASITKRSGPPDAEKRLYMTWTSGTMKAMDRSLLGRAGIPTARRVVMQFYPKATEDLLATAELAYAQQNGFDQARHIQKTVFSVQRVGNGYEYKVLEQRYRQLP